MVTGKQPFVMELARYAQLRSVDDQGEARFRPVLDGLFQRGIRDVPPYARRGAGLLQRGARFLRTDPPRGRRAGVQGLRHVLLEVRRGPLVGPKRCADNHGHEDDHLHRPPRAPQHAQPSQQGIHAASHSSAGGDGHCQGREVSEPPRPERFRRRAGVHCAVPRRGHHHDVGCSRGPSPTGQTLDR